MVKGWLARFFPPGKRRKRKRKFMISHKVQKKMSRIVRLLKSRRRLVRELQEGDFLISPYGRIQRLEQEVSKEWNDRS